MNFLSLFKRKILYKIRKKINIDSDEVYKKTLDDLFYQYGSDKADTFKQRQVQGHGFSKFYEQQLKHLKEKEIKILELGSFAGSSAAAFVKYFRNSSIYCFDINISKFIYESEKIHVFGLDINNEKKLNEVIKKINPTNKLNFFDIIIDDGSHYLSDILITFKNLYKHLNNGGIYIIEDFKFPNYYKTNKDIDHVFIDAVLDNLNKKKLFNSKILGENFQLYLQKEIKVIKIYKGNLKESDICFITRK